MIVMDEDLSDVSLGAMIRAAKRELAMRERVYPGLVERGKMKSQEAYAETRAMQAILKLLLTKDAEGRLI